MKTIGQWLNEGKTISYRDKEYILQHILKKNRVSLHTSLDKTLSVFQLNQCDRLSECYKKGVPLAYLLGETDFYGHTFCIDQDVFIPRPETEFLVNSVFTYFNEEKFSNLKTQPFYFMDFGSGSGCVGLSLLLRFPKAHLFAVDFSSKALDCTYKNAKALGVKDRISIVHSDVSQLNPKDFPSIYWVTANPPYVKEGDPHIDPSVLKYEPHWALFSGEKGLKSIRIWLDQAVRFLLCSKNQESNMIHSCKKENSLQGAVLKRVSYAKREEKKNNLSGLEKKISHSNQSFLSQIEPGYFFEIGYNQYTQVSSILKNHPQVSSFQYHVDQQGIRRIFQCHI